MPPTPMTLLLTLLLTASAADTPVDVLPEELQATFAEAEGLWGAGNPRAAAPLYAQINREAPTFDRAWRRRCGALLEVGEKVDAIDLCRGAVKLKASVENRTALAIALTQPMGAAARGQGPELDEARALLDAVIAEEPEYLPAWQAMCTWAVEGEDPETLGSCVDFLMAADPKNPGSLYYKALRHLADGEIDASVRALRQARQAGLPDAQFQPVAVQLASMGRAAAPAAGAQARTLAQDTKDEDASWADAIPWAIAALLVVLLGVAVFLGGDEDDDAPAA